MAGKLRYVPSILPRWFNDLELVRRIELTGLLVTDVDDFALP